MEEFLTKKKFKKGETIVTEGGESYDVYVVLSGEAEVVKTYAGKSAGVRTLKKGDVFGANALIVKSARLATVVARTDLEVGMIYRDDFVNMLETLPPDIGEMLKELVDQIKEAYEVSAELVLHTKKMLRIKEHLGSMHWQTLKDSESELPETAQIVVKSLELGLADMLHSYFKLANKLDNAVIEVSDAFTQSTGLRA